MVSEKGDEMKIKESLKKSWAGDIKLWKENRWIRIFSFLLIIGLAVICFVDYCLFERPFWPLEFRFTWWKTQPSYVIIADIVMFVLLFVGLFIAGWKTFKEISETWENYESLQHN